MKKLLKVFIILVLGLAFLCDILHQSAYADAPSTNVISCSESSDKAIMQCVLKPIVNTMTYGIGILGTIGVVITGIQYISSQGDPAKMAKAKNRLIMIVIGLVTYAVMYFALRFLVPGFNDEGILSMSEVLLLA